jgi:TerC family integral membrane protein
MTAGDASLSEPLAGDAPAADYGEIKESPPNPNKAREAFLFCLLGVCFSIGVSVWIRYDQSDEAMMEFYAGYMVEMSLSLDNLFAFYLVFKYFKVHSEAAQNRVLFWGILGAIVLRGLMVLAGSAMIHTFRPLLLICAVVLIFSAYQVLIIGEDDDDDEDLTDNMCVVLASKLIPVQAGYHGSDFMHEGKCTPLLLVLMVIEFSDVVFAVDSVPAIFGITENTIVVWAACMCAILCLRSLYTLVVQFVTDLPYMNNAIGIVLFFIALKLISDVCFGFKWPIGVSLGIVAGILGVGAIMSIHKKATDAAAEEAGDEEAGQA